MDIKKYPCYSSPSMKTASSSTPSKYPVAILGATGYVGRTLARLLSEHPFFELVALIGSPASVNREFGSVWAEKETKLVDHYGPIWQKKEIPETLAKQIVLSRTDVDFRTIGMVFSVVPDTAIGEESEITSSGTMLISNNPHGRLTYPLIVPELHPPKPTTPMIKMPNCVSIGLALGLAPLQTYGMKGLQATTFQSLSGQGDRCYPQNWALGNVFPIGTDVENTQAYIADELRVLLNLPFLPQIRSYRVYVQEGHLIDVTLCCEKALDRDTAIHLWKTWNPLNQVKGPLRVSSAPGEPKSQDTAEEGGMPVRIGNIQQIDPHTIAFTLGIHNILRGAAGNAILTAEWLLRD